MSNTNVEPVYRQIASLLIAEIQSGKLTEGERLSPERTLAKQFGVSVLTLRKSLALLAQQGMIQRIQGSGNYVQGRADVDNRYAFFRLQPLTGRGVPHARVLSVECLSKCSHDLPAFGEDTRAYRIRRIRCLDDQDCALEEIWLDGACVQSERAQSLMAVDCLPPSLYQLYKQELGLWISRAEDKLTLARVPDWCPDGMPFVMGDHAGFVERLAWGKTGVAVEFSRTWFDPAHVRYVSRIK